MKSSLFSIQFLSALILLSSLGCKQDGTSSSKTATTESSTSIASFALTPGSDIPTDPIPVDPLPVVNADCSFNNSTVLNGNSVTAYQNSSVAFGSSCVSENRTCTEGKLSGSYSYASCSVGAPASCLFDGQTIAHGTSVVAYSASSVSYNGACSSVAETRVCNNGVLSGTAQYSSCSVNTPRSCLFNGQTIPHNGTVDAYSASTTQYGGSCTSEVRTCVDGTLSGSYTYGSCVVDAPASCLFDGRTLAHGEHVTAFLNSAVAYGSSCKQEDRVCDNGTLSGAYSFSSCAVSAAANCSFDNKTVLHGESVSAFQSASVPYGSSCVSEARACDNGVLSGSYESASCVVKQAADCQFNDQIITHGSSITLYTTANVSFGSTCQSENRTCNNGTLSGSATYASCSVDNPPPAKSCVLNNQEVQSGQSVVTYQNATVPFGSQCVSETRSCQDGILSGSFTSSSCSVQAATNCTLNDKVIAHDSSITVFTSASVPYGSTCQSEVRICNNGLLSGSAINESCVVQPNPTTPPSCPMQTLTWEFPDVCKGNCGKGMGYFKSRVSRDGGKTWLVIMKNKLPDDLKEIWKYMIEKNGKNSCARPNVVYTKSKNKGYLVISPVSVPSCQVCKFVDVEVEDREEHHHGQCHKNQEHHDKDHKDKDSNGHHKKKKISIFQCGEKPKHHHKEHDDDDDHDSDHEGHRH